MIVRFEMMIFACKYATTYVVKGCGRTEPVPQSPAKDSFMRSLLKALADRPFHSG